MTSGNEHMESGRTAAFVLRKARVLLRSRVAVLILAVAAVALVSVVALWGRRDSKSTTDILPKAVFDLGERDAGEIVEFVVPVRNLRKERLRILGLRGDCSCLTATMARSTLQPGESGTVNARYHAPAVPGRTQNTLYVQTDDPHLAVASIQVKADTRPQIVVLPDVIDFGRVAPGTTPTRFTVVHSFGTTTPTLLRIEMSAPWVSAQWAPVERRGTAFGRIDFLSVGTRPAGDHRIKAIATFSIHGKPVGREMTLLMGSQ